MSTNDVNSQYAFDERCYNPSPLSQLPSLVAGTFLLLVGFYLRMRGIWMEDSDRIMTMGLIVGGLGAGLLLLVAWSCLNHRLCFCETYISRYSGLLSTNLRTSRLLYKHVRGVEIEQSIFGRIFNIGDLHVGSDNSRTTAEIVISGVRHPERIKDIILKRVEIAQELSTSTTQVKGHTVNA
jgi:uncharacterized membrane protein YdbT with pleckstrin-like domain